MPVSVLLALLLALAAVPAEALTVLNHGKAAVFRERRASALIRVGRDPRLAPLEDPTCAGAGEASLQVASYPVATNLVEAGPVVPLPCERWRRRGGGYVYTDPAAAGGVRRLAYSRTRLVVQLGGAGHGHVRGPVGYLEAWLRVGGRHYLVRLHAFKRNEPALLVTRRPSFAAAEGEAAFWDVLLGDDASASRQQVALHCLERAARRSRKDGRARFLLGMMHLYRFGQATATYATASETARAEIAAAHAALEAAVPLLWDGARGDSRVPGFAAAAKYAKGVVDGDGALVAAALADLDAAVALNPLFNVFDYFPVAQVVSPADPLFARVLGLVDELLAGPGAACLGTQPEICGDEGLAPRNTAGSLLLFGDLYAKGGRLAEAKTWYAAATAFARSKPPPYRFQALADARLADAADRVARYLDDDPANDDPLLGAGAEACAVCHSR
jgi:tetratricopeptide (TPR) repeat protein